MLRAISSSKAPKAIGPYSQAILANNTLYCSGQIPLDPASGQIVGDTPAQQTERVLQNLQAILQEAGFSFDHVVRCEVYLADIQDYQEVNQVYQKYFKGQAKPARIALEVAKLPKDALVEISCIAVK
jgi:2-iminobutanoate/2-iminopropanoate deaminase